MGTVVLFSACRIAFDAKPDGPAPSPQDSPGDITADTLAACTAMAPVDAFDPAASPCSTWGSVSMKGLTTARVNGALEIAPMATTPQSGDFGGCTISQYDLGGDILLEVSATLTGEGYTNATFYFASAYFGIQTHAIDGMIYAIHDGTQAGSRPFDPVAMRFWRLHPTTSMVSAEVSPDARTWTVIGTRTLLDQTTTVGNFTFGGGRNATNATGIARFESLNLCP
jgi:hypothetical protein